MNDTLKLTAGLLALIGATSAVTTGASAADEPAKFTYSFNVGATNDYVFRGYSQNKDKPAVQGGIDLGYGIAYFGLWASNINFGNSDLVGGSATEHQVHTELDIYGGIKPVLGPATFDLGVIYYAYPGANDGGASKNQVEKQEYVEFKAGVSGAFIPKLDKLTIGGTMFYSPEYQGKQGEVWTFEANAAYELPAVGPFTPTVSALWGAQYGTSSGTIGNIPVGKFNLGNGSDSLNYWNAGITLAVEKFSFDFRYWNTDISNAPDGTFAQHCNGKFLTCDERFVFLGKFTY